MANNPQAAVDDDSAAPEDSPILHAAPDLTGNDDHRGVDLGRSPSGLTFNGAYPAVTPST